MGRVGEVITRTWQTAHKMRTQRGALCGQCTLNPAITHGIEHAVGSIEAGRLADLALLTPAFFGARPSLVLKGGMIAKAAMCDPNAPIPTPQPVH